MHAIEFLLLFFIGPIRAGDPVPVRGGRRARYRADAAIRVPWPFPQLPAIESAALESDSRHRKVPPLRYFLLAE
jgi:hypothetical protein